MPQIRVYTTEICPRCKQLKDVLKSEELDYKEIDMGTAEALTELRVNGIFTASAPVLQIEDEFITSNDLFDGNGINRDSLKEFLPL